MDAMEKVQQYKSDVAFRTLVESVDEQLYIIPKYQRQYRWKKNQAQELIRSLILGYPIPPIYTYRNDSGQLEILDGQQRIMTLFFYYIGKFYDERKNPSIDFKSNNHQNIRYENWLETEYVMKTFDVELNGKNVAYELLPIEIKRKVDFTTITIIELRWRDGERRLQDMQQIFKNLNKGGAPLSDQEVREGVFGCKFYDMLHEFDEENRIWNRLWHRDDGKGSHIEMLLRLCAIEEFVTYIPSPQIDGSIIHEFEIEKYHSSYSKWIDDFSEIAYNMSDAEIKRYYKKLTSFFDRLAQVESLNTKKNLLDSLVVAVQKMGLAEDKVIDQRKIDLLLDSNSAFSKLARQGTTKVSQMKERWRSVYELLSQGS